MKMIHTDYQRDGFDGWYYPAAGSDCCMILLIGSDGDDIANKALASWFNKNGCSALGLGKHQNHDQFDGLDEWPLDYFDYAIAWLKKQEIRKFGLYGISIGANMALMAAALIPDFSLTIACEGIDFILEGFCEGKKEGMQEWCSGTSSFSYKGKPLSYVPYRLSEHEYDYLIKKSTKDHHDLSAIELYQYTERQEIEESSFIPIENIHGRLLIIAAGDDVMWESAKYAERMKKRLLSQSPASSWKVTIYPYGTHLLIPYSAGKIGIFDLGALVAMIWRSGRKNKKACARCRRQLESQLIRELQHWLIIPT